MSTLVISVVVAIAITTPLLVAWPTRTMAQTSQQVSFRLSRLETDVRSLQSQINQLETQLARVSRDSGMPAPPPAANIEPSPAESNLMFEQLATLVIETRQDMFALQDQIEAIEDYLNLN